MTNSKMQEAIRYSIRPFNTDSEIPGSKLLVPTYWNKLKSLMVPAGAKTLLAIPKKGRMKIQIATRRNWKPKKWK